MTLETSNAAITRLMTAVDALENAINEGAITPQTVRTEVIEKLVENPINRDMEHKLSLIRAQNQKLKEQQDAAMQQLDDLIDYVGALEDHA